jgi:hypothetical protein
MKGIAFHYTDRMRELWYDIHHNYPELEIYEIDTPEGEEQKHWNHVSTLQEVPFPKVLMQPQDAHVVKPSKNIFEEYPEEKVIFCFGPDNGYLTEWKGGDIFFIPSAHNMYSFQAAIVVLAYGHYR